MRFAKATFTRGKRIHSEGIKLDTPPIIKALQKVVSFRLCYYRVAPISLSLPQCENFNFNFNLFNKGQKCINEKIPKLLWEGGVFRHFGTGSERLNLDWISSWVNIKIN